MKPGQTAPIDRCPVDILCTIFRHCFAFPALASGEPCVKLELDSDLATIIRVCQKWRKLALNAPHLWTCIKLNDLASVGRAEVYVQRSRALPLDVVFLADTDKNADDIIKNFVVPHVGRLRYLAIVATVESLVKLPDLLEPLKTLSAPRLEYLFLGGECTYGQWYGGGVFFNSNEWVENHVDGINADVFCPTPTGAGGAPALRKLVCSPICISWDSPTIKNLSSLELRMFYSPMPTQKSLLKIIKANPKLRHLHLSFCALDREPDVPSNNAAWDTSLRQLETLILNGRRAHITSLLEHLAFPETTSCTLSSYMDREWEDHYRDTTFPRLPRNSKKRPSLEGFTKVVFAERDDVPSFEIHDSGYCNDYLAVSCYRNANTTRPALTVIRSLPEEDDYYEGALHLTKLSSFFDFSAIDTLVIAQDQKPSRDEWAQVFLGALGVRRLRLSALRCQSIRNALKVLQTAQKCKDGSTKVFLPALEVLELELWPVQTKRLTAAIEKFAAGRKSMLGVPEVRVELLGAPDDPYQFSEVEDNDSDDSTQSEGEEVGSVGTSGGGVSTGGRGRGQAFPGQTTSGPSGVGGKSRGNSAGKGKNKGKGRGAGQSANAGGGGRSGKPGGGRGGGNAGSSGSGGVPGEGSEKKRGKKKSKKGKGKGNSTASTSAT